MNIGESKKKITLTNSQLHSYYKGEESGVTFIQYLAYLSLMREETRKIAKTEDPYKTFN